MRFHIDFTPWFARTFHFGRAILPVIMEDAMSDPAALHARADLVRKIETLDARLRWLSS